MPPQKWSSGAKGAQEDAPYGHCRKMSSPDRAWDAMFQRLLKFKEKHGHTLVPAKYKEDSKLSHWVQTQRSCRKRPRSLSKERIKQLDSIGFVWSVNQALWDSMFESLLEYREEHGHVLVPQSWPQLGQWVDRQRTDKAENRLSPERRKKLESVGFVWRVSQDSWDSMFARLLKFRETHGTCLVPQRYEEDPRLGNWVDKQRYLKNTNRLSEERKEKLDDIGFSWCVSQESWESMFSQLVEYKEEHGNDLVSVDYADNPKLGRWVKEQRKKRHRLSEKRSEQLDSIGFVWSVPQAIWNSMFQSLLDYKEKHGNCLVPKRFLENPQLGRWVHNQRLRRDNLSLERVEKLESIGFYATKSKSTKLVYQQTNRACMQQDTDEDEAGTAASRDSPRRRSTEYGASEQSASNAIVARAAMMPASNDAVQSRSGKIHLSENGTSPYAFSGSRHSSSDGYEPDTVGSSKTSESQDVDREESLALASSSYGNRSRRSSMPSVDNRVLRPVSAGLSARDYQLQTSTTNPLDISAHGLMLERMELELRARELQASMLRYHQMQSLTGLMGNPSYLPGHNMPLHLPLARQPVLPYPLVVNPNAALPPAATAVHYSPHMAPATAYPRRRPFHPTTEASKEEE